jgi:hypothetical protein
MLAAKHRGGLNEILPNRPAVIAPISLPYRHNKQIFQIRLKIPYLLPMNTGVNRKNESVIAKRPHHPGP